MLAVQILLRMNQFQLAEQRLQQLRTQDGAEDTSLFKLASCWLVLQSGDRSKFQEAVYKYEELVDKYSELTLCAIVPCLCLCFLMLGFVCVLQLALLCS